MRTLGRNRAIIYGVIFTAVSLLTFFWLDSRDHDESVYRDAPVSLETNIITTRYRIKTLESRIRDLRSGDYRQRLQGLGRGNPHISDEMIRREIIEAEQDLQQARKRLAELLRE